MAIKIFPTENDVGTNPGDGRAPTEANLTKWITSIRGPHSRVKRAAKMDPGGVLEAAGGGFGFEFVSGAATTVTLAPGDAEVLGFEVESDANLVATLTAATFNWVFLQLIKVSGKVTGAQLTVTTSGSFSNGPSTVPADSILLWCFSTSLTVITAQFDFRSGATDQITGEYLGDGNFSQSIDLGLRPKLVYVVRNDVPRFASWSEPDFILDAVTPTNWGSYIAEIRNGRCGVAGLIQDDAIRPRLLENGFQVNLGPFVPACTEILQGSATFDPPSIVSLGFASTTVTVTGAVVGEAAWAMHEGLGNNAQVVVRAIVSAANTVTVRFTNPSASSISVGALNSGALRVFVLHENTQGFSLNTLNDLYQFVAWY